MKARLAAWATGSPLDLAVFRVAVSVVVLGTVDVWDAHRWAAAAVAPPAGWGLVGALVPPTPTLALVMTGVVLVGALVTLVGFHTRVAAVVTALSLAWLLAVPQFSGQVLHSHHLVWFFALLAAGPSGDALALDARRAGRVPGPSVAHGLPVRFAWLTIGLLFFFPGAWKLAAGSAWLEGLPALVAWKRFQLGLPGDAPLSNGALQVGGALAVLLELTVLPLVLFRRTRVVAALGALGFHLGVQAVMGIGFSSLWACYVVFGDWARWLRRDEPAQGAARSTRPTVLVGGALLAAMVVTGALGREDWWPVACYPTFRAPAPAVVRWVEIHEHGVRVFGLPELRGGRGQRWWGLVMRVAQQPTRESLEQLHRQWRGGALPAGAEYFVVTRGAELERRRVP